MAVSPRDSEYTFSERRRSAPTAVLDVPAVQVAVTGRMCEIRPSFRAHAEELLSRVGKFDDKVTRVELELSRAANPRQSGSAFSVELTVRSKGKLIRAEAAAATADAALDLAWQKLQLRLRRSHRKRVDHTPRRARYAPAAVLPGIPREVRPDLPHPDTTPADDHSTAHVDDVAEGPFRLTEARQEARPMTVTEALAEMELTGQEILSFIDRQGGEPCVLHRGRGYSYALMRLEVPQAKS